jgi:VWFA-related protein
MTMGITVTPRITNWVVVVAVGVGLGVGVARAQDQTPRFRSGVDVTSVDVTVVDDRGRPILGLKPEDFAVRLDGNQRRVISADWVPLTTPEGPKPPPPPEGYTSNEGGSGGRLILLVVDQPNIRFGGFIGIRKAVNGFIDRLQSSDRVALVGIGPGASSVPFTADRERLRKAVEKTTGQRQTMSRGFYSIAISEAMAVRRGDAMMLHRVQIRECGDPSTAPPREAQRIEMCFVSVEGEIHAVAATSSFDGEQTMNMFRDLLGQLRSVNSPNTLVLITEGFVLDDQHPSFTQISSLAAASRTSIYVMKLDEQLFDISEARAPEPTARFEDRNEKSIGVEMLASATRGSLFNIVNSGDFAFERIEAELSGQYLLGVESNPLDKDGKPHSIDVSVNRRGVTVRSRRQLTMRPEDNRPKTARETVLAGLGSPLPLSALPLRVATFALQGQGRDGKVQLVIHADIGVNYTTTRPLSLGYMFTDKDGRIVESQTASQRLKPMLEGVPSPLQFTGGAALPPGDYTLKIAVVDGDLAGSLEHPVHATLLSAGDISLSELMVGGPVDPSEVRPTVGHTVTFGNLQAYLEAYGAPVKGLKVRYEIAATPDGDAMLAADVPARAAGDERAIFNRVLPVRQLPPGSYLLRAVLTAETGLAKSPLSLLRPFEIAPPAVLMTSADRPPPAGPSATELFLPVGEEVFDRPFDRSAMARPATLGTFRSRVAEPYVATFDKGVTALEAGDYLTAETSFKAAITPTEDSSAALTYLAATFAASGHDREAASAWQTALIDGAAIPEIYLWLGDTLLRVHDLPHARAILEEAVGKWPTDARFAKPLSMLYATMGLGREAVRTMQRHLEAQPADVEGLFMGVEWIYNLHQLGAVARSKAEDLKVARTYAGAYERAKGPQVALVKQWIEYLDPPPTTRRR